MSEQGGRGDRRADPSNLHLSATRAICCARVLSAVSLPAWLPGRARLRTSTARDLVAIGLLALALRLAWAVIYGRVDAGPHDALFYEIAASNLASGHGYTQLFGGATAHWPPGFPFLVSLLYHVFGTHVKLGLALNVLLGSATAPLLYLIGRELFGRAGGACRS